MWVQVGVGGWGGFVYAFLQLPFGRRPGFALQEGRVASDDFTSQPALSLSGEDALICCE